MHDVYVIESVKLALKAAEEGNYGVGAILVDPNGKIIIKGHNKVFHPNFRSDMHAEMDVMTEFESKIKTHSNLSDYTLFTSLEPCPMCLIRLIISGIGKIYYAVDDFFGGMVRRIDAVPLQWREIASGRVFKLADCSAQLREFSSDIFMFTVEKNDQKLRSLKH